MFLEFLYWQLAVKFRNEIDLTGILEALVFHLTLHFIQLNVYICY